VIPLTDITPVLVTRGDVELDEIIDSITRAGLAPLIVYNNNERDVDYKVYGRYVGISEATTPYVYVQDDDCLINIPKFLRVARKYIPGVQMVVNMPASRWGDYPDSCLVGWGALFARELPAQAFDRYYAHDMSVPDTEESAVIASVQFLKTCDVAFTTLTPHVKIDVGFQHLPWAEDRGRAMFLQPDHGPIRERMLQLARQVRDG
jgi:hypothetical protein